MKTVLLLEDNPERVTTFRTAVDELGDDWQVQHWSDAAMMLAECENFFESVALISLGHGLEFAKFLSGHVPLCPVIVHSANTDQAWPIYQEFRFAKWQVALIEPLGENWIAKLWLPKARELLATPHSGPSFRKPPDHAERLKRASDSLIGLAIGDALGEMLAYRHENAPRTIREGLAAGPWFHTDDTEMAISIVEVLRLFGYVHQEALARRFAWHFQQDPDRGYGKMTRIQLREILAGADWRETARSAFSGQGSMGNGGAMRVAPLGAYFADDLERVAEEARLSSLVTHTHPEGVAGTIAVALAAAMAWQLRQTAPNECARQLFAEVLRLTPESEVRQMLVIASQTSPDQPSVVVAKKLGNGSLITAQDTAPFAIWSAAHHLDNYVEALSQTISVGGDCDTNAAIVGGIIAAYAGVEGIPEQWQASSECIRLL